MKKLFVFILLVILWLPFCFAQSDDVEAVPLPKSLRTNEVNLQNVKKERKIKMLAGGYVGFQFGTFNNIELAPHFGFYPAEWLCIGVGGLYMFMSQHYMSTTIKTHDYGFNAFVEGYAWKRLILHASYEYVNYARAYLDPNNKIYTERIGCHGILVGVGYKHYITDNVSMYSLILFNLNQNTDSFYSNPLFRVGVNYDF